MGGHGKQIAGISSYIYIIQTPTAHLPSKIHYKSCSQKTRVRQMVASLPISMPLDWSHLWIQPTAVPEEGLQSVLVIVMGSGISDTAVRISYRY